MDESHPNYKALSELADKLGVALPDYWAKRDALEKISERFGKKLDLRKKRTFTKAEQCELGNAILAHSSASARVSEIEAEIKKLDRWMETWTEPN